MASLPTVQLLQLSGDEQLNFILHCLRQPWGLSEDEVLSRLQTIMDHVSKLKMDLPPLGRLRTLQCSGGGPEVHGD